MGSERLEVVEKKRHTTLVRFGLEYDNDTKRGLVTGVLRGVSEKEGVSPIYMYIFTRLRHGTAFIGLSVA